MQAELHLPHGGRGVSNLASPRFVDGGGRQPKVRMIESVEVLPTELERLPLSNNELFHQRQVEKVLGRAAQRAFRRRAVAEGLLRRGVNIGLGIEPEVAV